MVSTIASARQEPAVNIVKKRTLAFPIPVKIKVNVYKLLKADSDVSAKMDLLVQIANFLLMGA